MSLFSLPQIPDSVSRLFRNAEQEQQFSVRKVLMVTTRVIPASVEEERMMTMMNKACGLRPDEYYWLQAGPELQPWARLMPFIQPSCVLLCGISLQELGINAFLQPYSLQPFGGATFIICDAPHALSDDRLRKKLWQDALKPYFHGGA